MSDAPYDVLAYFGHPDEDELELHEFRVGDTDWLPIADPALRQLDSTLLVVSYQRGVHHIAVKHGDRVVEFDLGEVIVRDGSPLTTIERKSCGCIDPPGCAEDGPCQAEASSG